MKEKQTAVMNGYNLGWNGIINRSCYPETFANVFLKKLCKIHKKIIMVESLLNEVSGLETYNFSKK